jgi:hypothetical protein
MAHHPASTRAISAPASHLLPATHAEGSGAPAANRGRTPVQRAWMARLCCALLSLRGSRRAVGRSLARCWPSMGEGCRPRSLARAAPVAPLVIMQRLGGALPCRAYREGLFYFRRSLRLGLAWLVLILWLSVQLAEGSASRPKHWRSHWRSTSINRAHTPPRRQRQKSPEIVWPLPQSLGIIRH